MTTPAATAPNALARPLRAWDYFVLNAYWFGLSFLWNSMGPIVLPTLVTQLIPASQQGSAIGALGAVGLIIATIVQPLAGAYSDSRTTHWGKRRPYLIGGTLFDVIFLLAIFFARDYIALLIAYALLQVVSNIAHGPYQSYIPELVPEAKRGAVTGIKQLFEMIGLIITSLAVGTWIDQGQLWLAFAAIIFFLLFTMILTAVFVTEQPYAGMRAAPAKKSEPITLAALPQIIFHSRDFFLWLVSRLLILLGTNLVRNYVLLFFRDVLHLENPAGQVGTLLAVIGVAVAVVVYPAGILSDRLGRKTMVLISGVLGALGALMLIPATSLTAVLIAGSVIGVSTGIFLSADWAWATDLIPSAESGRFLGISNIATAGSGVLAGIGGGMLDLFNAQAPNLGYTALYVSAAICFGLGTLVAFGVQDTRKRQP